MRACVNEKTCYVCHCGKFPRCAKYRPARDYGAFGWEVTVDFHNGSRETFHWRGLSGKAACRKGMLKTGARRLVLLSPVTRDEWVRAYGLGRM